MAIPRSTWGLLLAAFLAAFSGLLVATRLAARPPREAVSPDAWQALDRNDPEQAASIFKRELKEHPRDPVLHFGAGSAAYALGRTDVALASLRRAVELDPEYADALALLGQVAYERGDSDLAVRSLQKASSLRPRDRRIADLLDRWQRESSVHNSYVEKPIEHFRILYEGGAQQSVGDRVARVLEEQYGRIGRALNSFPSEPVTVILYTNVAFH